MNSFLLSALHMCPPIPGKVNYPVASEVFSGVEIKGRVCYFLWDRDSKGACDVITIRDNNSYGPISHDLGEFEVFVRDSRVLDILHKVIACNEASITEIVSVDKEFGWASNFDGFHNKKASKDVAIYYKRKASDSMVG